MAAAERRARTAADERTERRYVTCNAIASFVLLLYFMFAKIANGPSEAVVGGGVQDGGSIGLSRTAVTFSQMGQEVPCSSAHVAAAHAGRHWYLEAQGRPTAQRLGLDHCSKSSWVGYLPVEAEQGVTLPGRVASRRCKFNMLHACKDGSALMYSAPLVRKEWSEARGAFLRAHRRREPKLPRGVAVVHTPCEAMGESLGRIWRGGSTTSFDATLAQLDAIRARSFDGTKRDFRVLLLASNPPPCATDLQKAQDTHFRGTQEQLLESLVCEMSVSMCKYTRDALKEYIEAKSPVGAEYATTSVELRDADDGNDEFMLLARAPALVGSATPSSLFAAVAAARSQGATMMPRSSQLLNNHPKPLTAPAIDIAWFESCGVNVNRRINELARNITSEPVKMISKVQRAAAPAAAASDRSRCGGACTPGVLRSRLRPRLMPRARLHVPAIARERYPDAWLTGRRCWSHTRRSSCATARRRR